MNKKGKTTEPAPQQLWLTKKKILCVALLLLAAGYVLAQPTLERWLGVELPSLVDREEDKGDADKAADNWADPKTK